MKGQGAGDKDRERKKKGLSTAALKVTIKNLKRKTVRRFNRLFKNFVKDEKAKHEFQNLDKNLFQHLSFFLKFQL